MRVLALDPGERVGWARADIADDGTWTDLRHGITPLKDMAIAVHKALYPVAEYKTINALVENEDRIYDLVVMEDWRLYPQQAKTMIGSNFPSVQFVGMVRLCCWISGTQLVIQGADVKSTADKTMKVLRPELYAKVAQGIRHDDGHDLDALRHLWFWIWKNIAVQPQTQEAACES